MPKEDCTVACWLTIGSVLSCLTGVALWMTPGDYTQVQFRFWMCGGCLLAALVLGIHARLKGNIERQGPLYRLALASMAIAILGLTIMSHALVEKAYYGLSSEGDHDGSTLPKGPVKR